MKFGICTGHEQLQAVERAGGDYIECNVVNLNQLDNTQLINFSNQLKSGRIKTECMCVLFPRTISLIGDNVDINEIKDYLSNTFKRLSILEPKIIVFGSGASRKRPEDFCPDKAYEQLITTCRIITEQAAPYNISIALEPLNKTETNMINTIPEAVKLVKAVNKPGFKMIADLYHMQQEDEPASVLSECKDILIHTHIATKTLREAPKHSDKAVFAPYFDMLKKIGYNGRMSIEGKIEDGDNHLTEAFKVLHSFQGGK